MRTRILTGLTLAGALLVGLVPTVAASDASCAGQFASSAAKTQEKNVEVAIAKIEALATVRSTFARAITAGLPLGFPAASQ